MTKQTQSGTDAIAVDVSSSDVTLSRTCRAIWVGTTGDLEIIMESGNTVIFPSANGLMPLQADKILNANTTAAGIVAIF